MLPTIRLITQTVRLHSKINLKLIQRNCSSSFNFDLKLNDISLNNLVERIENEYKELSSSDVNNDRLLELQPLINVLDQRKVLAENLIGIKDLLNDNDSDMQKLAYDEKMKFEEEIKRVDEELIKLLIPKDEEDSCTSLVLEVNAGVGGQEAMLFASELFEMYSNFAEYKGWEYETAEYLTTELGGLRHGSLLIRGDGVYRFFKYEAGVHRVQRIPATEKSGRIHTSTVSVIALPQPDEIQINIQNKDLRIETKRASGAGGQHVNTTDSAVRITHIPTGISVECQVDRSQIKNRNMAMERLRAKLYQIQLDQQIAESSATRKSQVRSNTRNEKIRTYNFSQDRITDHRMQGCNFHNLKVFLNGGEDLENLIDKLHWQTKQEDLLELVNELKNKV